MKELFEANRVNYILRAYLPTWNYEERIEEMVRFCGETGTGHVMLFTDAQPLVWNQLTLEEVRHGAENISRAGQRLASEGIRFGINSSYNMPISRWDHRKHNDYDFWATYSDGSCEYRTPCLLDPKLDGYLRSFYAILAETNPEYIYIDDDHRYVLTGQKNTWGCFCELHLRKFGEITGKKWTRESLDEALRNDAGIRRQWIEFLGARLLAIADIMRTSIHRVNPEIAVGLMVPCIHQLPTFGHTIKNMTGVLSPKGNPLVRPCIGPYNDHNRRQIIPGLFYLYYTGHLLGDDAVYTPEIETWPFTRMSKSMTLVELHIVHSLLNRMNNPAISLCGYSGDTPFFEPAWVDFLKGNRNYFEGVRKIAPSRDTGKGIQFLFDFASATAVPHPIKGVTDLYWQSFVLYDIIGNSGFPCTYDESPIRFLAGDTAYALSEQRIIELLRSGLVLDASAARALAERGFADMIGCCPGGNITGFGSEECISENYFGQYSGSYIPLFTAPTDGVFALNTKDGATEISVIVDHDRKKIANGVVLFENKSGGKIAVLPYAIGAFDPDLSHFICYQRQEMFRRIFEWMNSAAVPVLVEKPSDFSVHCWDDGKRLTVCVTNLSCDIADEITVNLQAGDLSAEKASYVSASGELLPLSGQIEEVSGGSGTRWKIKGVFAIFKPFVMVIGK